MSEQRMDYADRRASSRGSYDRRIKVPGKGEHYANTDPVAIARALRATSELGQRERRLG